MLVIYMPIVREATHAYVQLWNHHRIRKQPNRPNAVTGFPYLLYHYPPPGISSYEVPISQEYISKLEIGLEKWGKKFAFVLPHYFLNTPIKYYSYDNIVAKIRCRY